MIKVILLVGVLMLMRLYVVTPRSSLRDRLIMVILWTLTAVSVIAPSVTTWAARGLNVSRGADLAFYLGFILVFFVVGSLRVQVRDQQHQVSCLTREIALLKADIAESSVSPRRARERSSKNSGTSPADAQA